VGGGGMHLSTSVEEQVKDSEERCILCLHFDFLKLCIKVTNTLGMRGLFNLLNSCLTNKILSLSFAASETCR
jgi:hypothetical protein